MRTPELIVAHTNTDFDAFAAMLAVRKLYPEAWISLGGAVNRNVREFQALYADLVPVVDPADVERESVRRLILVDTAHPNRIGDLADLCTTPGVELVVFDHHTPPSELPACVPREALVTSGDGALVTLLVHILASRRIPITPFEATVFALGIHEDTGSLTFATTTPRDAQALALCMEMGADTTLIERWITNVLSEEQRRTLAGALEAAERLPLVDAEVLMVVLRREVYVEGVSVVAHRMMDLTGCDACFLLVEMEHRVFVTARSRGARVDVARVLGGLGGGGHRSAASAVVKDRTLEETAAAIAAAVPAAVTPVRRAADVLVPFVPLAEATLTVDEAAIRCREEGLDGLVVADGEFLVGRVALADLERASAHGLGHAPVKAVMTAHLSAVPSDAPLDRVAEAIVRDEVGWVLVTARPGANGIARADVLGTIAREAVAVRPAAAEAEPLSQAGVNLAGRLGELGLDDLLRHIQAASAVVRGVYLVGGAVRDLLLGEPGFDIDLAVEGDGIAFAEDLAQRL
jgi:tRNA nucleotidyltransferase (CCA-adding enzyme)